MFHSRTRHPLLFSPGPQVLFVCTANVLDTIPAPLLDRMEVIRLVGYITDEKMHIAREYLEPAAQKGAGVREGQVEVSESALLALAEEYCREAGVRSLQKHIEKIYRKVGRQPSLKFFDIIDHGSWH